MGLNGRTVILDLNGKSSGRCDLLITHQPDSLVQASVTFLLQPEWPLSEELTNASQYWLIQKDTPVYADIYPDGQVRIAAYPLDR